MHKLKDYGALITLAIFSVGVVASAATAQYQIRSQGIRLNAIETQQATDHDTLTEISVDVRWIRESLEHEAVR
jgi:hypothetical protein